MLYFTDPKGVLIYSQLRMDKIIEVCHRSGAQVCCIRFYVFGGLLTNGPMKAVHPGYQILVYSLKMKLMFVFP
jgi:hypothetical protein